MKPLLRNARAAVGFIVILTAGCDNVSWGGADLAVVPPPPKASSAPADSGDGGLEPMPDAPILYYVARSAAGAFMTPVGQITGDSLAPIRSSGDAATYGTRFIAEFLREGAEFTLFSGGRRAGTFLVRDAALPGTPACPLLPTASGALELSGDMTATEFLALARADAPSIQPRAARVEVPNRLRIVAPILAERMIRVRGATLPGNWQTAMEQLTAFPVANQPNPAFTATFLVGDTLGPGMDNDGYSLFFIGVPTASQTGYDTTYVNFRSYPETGKAAPRVIDYLDWNRDEAAEVLMQVYGVNDSWFEAIGRTTSGTWRRIFSDRCEEGGRTLTAPIPAPPDSV
ncbi:MAG: hypothetical protein WEF86_04485, partial [Gemmatimonadota bacterium]